MSNLFDKFKTAEKVVKVKALGADVTIRELTVAESNDFYKMIITGYGDDGKPEVNLNNLAEVKLQKVSACLLDPKMTIDELKGLGSGASTAIEEISNAIDELSNMGKKKS